MSDMYLPDLVELNSYWQKAVEDAIRDTVKGEEKLQNALRNRKKINEKLKKFGLDPVFSALPYSKRNSPKVSAEVRQEPESDSEESGGSFEEEESLHNFDSRRSKSSATAFEDDKQKSPIRPLFGNGSLDKIKRSQNSFNCEPMGEEGNSDDLSESEKDGKAFTSISEKDTDVERNKNIRWLHVRNDQDFENSDSDSFSGGEEGIDPIQLLRHPYTANKKFFLNETLRPKPEKKMSRMSKKFQNSDLLSGDESNSTMEEHKTLKRRLELALAKREILNKKRKVPGGAKSKALIKVGWSAAKEAEKRTKGKKQLSSFIKFYLEVYRELCLKMPVKRIAEEAARRWRAMNAKEKADWTDDTKAAGF